MVSVFFYARHRQQIWRPGTWKTLARATRSGERRRFAAGHVPDHTTADFGLSGRRRSGQCSSNRGPRRNPIRTARRAHVPRRLVASDKITVDVVAAFLYNQDNCIRRGNAPTKMCPPSATRHQGIETAVEEPWMRRVFTFSAEAFRCGFQPIQRPHESRMTPLHRINERRLLRG